MKLTMWRVVVVLNTHTKFRENRPFHHPYPEERQDGRRATALSIISPQRGRESQNKLVICLLPREYCSESIRISDFGWKTENLVVSSAVLFQVHQYTMASLFWNSLPRRGLIIFVTRRLELSAVFELDRL